MRKTLLALALLTAPAGALDWTGDPLTAVALPRFETVLQAQPLGSDKVSKEYAEDDAGLILSPEASGRVVVEFEAGEETLLFVFPQLRYDASAKTISRDGAVIGRLGKWFWEFEPGWRFGWRIETKAGAHQLSVFLRR